MPPLRPTLPLRTRRSPRHIRNFHPTRPAPFVNEVLEVSSSFIHGVHSVSGLSWALSIPLTAVIVRTSIAMPLQMFSRLQARKERDLLPLLNSWSKYYSQDLLRRKGQSPDSILPPDIRRDLAKCLKKKREELHKRFQVVPYWKGLNFLQLPIWISVMESLRAMSGNDKGLIPYLLSLVEPASRSAGSSPLHLAVEPSLATEGALWFPDLLAGDTTGLLPAALTLSILLNVRAGWKVPPLRDLADLPKPELAKQFVFRGLRAFIQFMALNVGLSAYVSGMPSALMLYWITSSNIATLQTLFLEKYMFAKKPLKPWRQVFIAFPKPWQNGLATKK
ncbi:60Kd inner membrane protein-domain-containing protein [Aspergillus ambiguus]|uniref:putative mitochondrial export translocase Oxa2 n=1 Tax=Aspergillus ambiguus TaxID=176160 RepID=UPI003CCC94E2